MVNKGVLPRECVVITLRSVSRPSLVLPCPVIFTFLVRALLFEPTSWRIEYLGMYSRLSRPFPDQNKQTTQEPQELNDPQRLNTGALGLRRTPGARGFRVLSGLKVLKSFWSVQFNEERAENVYYVPRTKQQMVGGSRWQKCCLMIQDFGLYGSLNFIKSVCDPLWPPWLKLPNIGTWCDCVVLAVKFVRNTKHNYVCTHVHCTYGFEIIESS